MTWELFYGFSISTRDLVTHLARWKGLLGEAEIPTRDIVIRLLSQANLFPHADDDTFELIMKNEELIHDLFYNMTKGEFTLNLAINYNQSIYILGRSILYLDSRAYRNVTPFKEVWNDERCRQIREELEKFGCSKEQLDVCELVVIKHDNDSSSGF
jgi:hypothetical protein